MLESFQNVGCHESDEVFLERDIKFKKRSKNITISRRRSSDAGAEVGSFRLIPCDDVYFTNALRAYAVGAMQFRDAAALTTQPIRFCES